MCAAACAQTMLVQPAPLSVRGVFASLHRMAAQKGAGAAKRRTQTILALLRSCRSLLHTRPPCWARAAVPCQPRPSQTPAVQRNALEKA